MNWEIVQIFLASAVLIIAVASAIGIIIYPRRLFDIKQPIWSRISRNVIYNENNLTPGLEITYYGEKIDHITNSQILFWNHGTKMIHSQDISTTDPVRIKVDKTVKILDVKVLPSSLPADAFQVEVNQDENLIFIRFDSLDRGQGAVIQILHTGKPSDEVRVLGSIKGAPSIEYLENPIELLPSALARVSLSP